MLALPSTDHLTRDIVRMINTHNLMEYWLDAEWWELPLFSEREQEPITPLIGEINKVFAEQAKRTSLYVRLYLGIHQAHYHITPDNIAFEKNKPAFILSYVLCVTRDKDDKIEFQLELDKGVCNRALIMYLCLHKYGKPVRRDVARRIEDKLYYCIQHSHTTWQPADQTISQHLFAQQQLLMNTLVQQGFGVTLLQPRTQADPVCLYRFVSKRDDGRQFVSFFERDLQRLQQEKLSPLVTSYLARQAHKPAYMLTNSAQDLKALQQYLHRDQIPLGAWPSNTKHGLVYMQYTALQLARHKTPITAVNGPPGTGKTTLLKDYVADRFVERTRDLVTWIKQNPQHSKKQIPTELLLSAAMIVASSNNTAIENISKTLPNYSDDMQAGYPQLAYFKDLLNGPGEAAPLWGMFSATLGRQHNRQKFMSQSYAVDEKTQQVQLPGFGGRLLMHLFSLNDPGKLKYFLRQVKQQRQDPHNQYRNYCQEAMLQIKFYHAQDSFTQAWRQHIGATVDYVDPKDLPTCAKYLLSLSDLNFNSLFEKVERAQQQSNADNYYLRQKRLRSALSDFDKQMGQHAALIQNVVPVELSHADRNTLHKTAPWSDEAIRHSQTLLFQQALLVNEAYIESISSYVIDKLTDWRDYVLAPWHVKADPNQQQRIDDAWACFFLCFPIMSTTFHSVASQFATMPYAGKFGCALIDEAGQALPYQAVGLLSRCQQAVVVGDPLQLEPVCTLPNAIDWLLAKDRELSTDLNVMKNYLVTCSSVQSFADAAACVQGKINEMTVGIPLSVHRRCDNPMFAYCNQIAYGNSMVHYKQHAHASYPNLHDAAWLQCEGRVSYEGTGYYNRTEINVVYELLMKLYHLQQHHSAETLAQDPLFPIYIITPFRIMANKLNATLRKIPQFKSLFANKMIICNTTHSFQGQEAPTIIMPLTSDVTKSGSAAWVNKNCNLMNVAISRAKRRMYIVGDATVWANTPFTGHLLKLLPIMHSSADILRKHDKLNT